jgi:hypothetical protein
MGTAEIRHLSDEDKAVLAEVRETFASLMAQDPRLTEAECVRRYLPFHNSAWSKLQSDSYTGATSVKIAQCRQAIADMEASLANMQRVRSVRRFHWLRTFEAVVDAITIARDTDNENRLVIYLAPTGGGKSELCRQLAAKHSASVCEAKESWKDSYFASCADVCAAIGAKGQILNKRAAEQRMIASMIGRAVLLAIDEGATSFSVHTANMVKLVLNQTRAVVVMCGTPELVDRMLATSEGMQLMRRSLAVIRSEKITPKDARVFLPYKWADEASALSAAATAANQFGMYDLLTRVNDALAQDYNPGDVVQTAELTKAIDSVRRCVGFKS